MEKGAVRVLLLGEEAEHRAFGVETRNGDVLVGTSPPITTVILPS